VLDSWNLKNDTCDILVTNYENVMHVGRVHKDAPAEFRLYHSTGEWEKLVCIRLVDKCIRIESNTPTRSGFDSFPTYSTNNQLKFGKCARLSYKN